MSKMRSVRLPVPDLMAKRSKWPHIWVFLIDVLIFEFNVAVNPYFKAIVENRLSNRGIPREKSPTISTSPQSFYLLYRKEIF